MDRAPWVLAFALVGLACRHQDDGDDDFGEDDLAGVETPASEHPPMASCPAGAPTLGIADGTAVDRVALNWDSNGVESYVDDYLYFMVPDDILSLMIAVEHDAELTSVNSMVLDNQVYIDMLGAFGEAPFWHWPVAVASVAMPISENTLPRGGCLVLDPVAYADLAGESGTLHIVSRRGPSVPTLIDVNVYLVGDTQIPQADIDAALAHMDELYQNGGSAALGQVTFETIDWPDPFVDSEGPEADQLRASTSVQRPNAINLLFIQDFNEVGTLGIAAGIPGPNGVAGTAASGVMVSVDTHLDGDGTTILTDLMGETMAHEVGHQLGLFHTSEDTGLDHDGIADTPECGLEYDSNGDEELSAEECEAHGGRNFMFWASSDEFGQYEMSATQAMVLRDSVIARPQ